MTPKAPSGRCLGPDCTNPVAQKQSGRPRLYCSDACGARYRKARPQPDTTAHLHRALDALAELVGEMRQALDEQPREALALHPRLEWSVKDISACLVKLGSSKKMTVKEIASTMHVSVSTVARRRSADNRGHPDSGPAELVAPTLASPRFSGARPTQRHTQSTDDDGGSRGGGPPGKRRTTALASALSFLQRASSTTRRELAAAAGVHPSYVSRILSGERLPSWHVVKDLCRYCKTDPSDLRPLWDAARGHRVPRQDSLSAALRGLRLAAARPGLDLLQKRARVPADDITAVLNGAHVPEWHATARLVTALGGEPEAIHPLWHAAHKAARAPNSPTTCALPASAFG